MSLKDTLQQAADVLGLNLSPMPTDEETEEERKKRGDQATLDSTSSFAPSTFADSSGPASSIDFGSTHSASHSPDTLASADGQSLYGGAFAGAQASADAGVSSSSGDGSAFDGASAEASGSIGDSGASTGDGGGGTGDSGASGGDGGGGGDGGS